MNRVALVTGGTRGIGRSIVETFYKAGYSVAACYISSDEAAQRLKEDLPGVLTVRCDVKVEEQIKCMVSRVIDEFGHIDALINNAGVASYGLLTELGCEEFDLLCATNLRGPFLCCREVLPSMIRRQSGVIVNISSMWGISGASCEVAYSATKAGIIGFTRALAREMGPSGIRVNCVAPGLVMTDMNRHLSQEDLEALRDETALGRFPSAQDIAQTVLFLCSDAAGSITGQVLCADAGQII